MAVTIYCGLTWTGSGSPGLNVFNIAPQGGASAVTAANEAIGDLATFYTSLASLYAAGSSVTVGDRVIDNDVIPPEYVAATSQVVALGTPGPDTAPALQICVTWRSSLATRAGRGRTFIGPLNDTVVGSDGTVNTSIVSTVQSAADTLIAASLASANYRLRVGAVWSPPPVILSAKVKTDFAVLRSRRD